MSAPVLEPEPTAGDALMGRTRLVHDIAIYLATWDLDLTRLSISHDLRVEYATQDYCAAEAVAAAFGAVRQGDRRTVVEEPRVWAEETWASDVLTVSWCKRLEVAS